MARFLKQPQQQLVQMGSPLDVDFYSKILDKSQQNRNQAVGMQMEYVDKINNLPVYTETDRAATSGKVQDRLTKMLDKSFVTPSQMARTVMELNQEITPGIQALKAKDQAAKLYDDMRVKYGANALMGTDPRNIDITDASGRYRDPGSYRALGVNLDDVRKNFLLNNTARLAQSSAPTYTKGGNVPAGYIQTAEKTGLDVNELATMYAPGSPLAIEEAKKQLQAFPDFIEIKGGEQQAMDYLMNLNQQTAMANAQKVNYGLVGDREYIDAETRARLSDNENNRSTTKDTDSQVIYRDPKISPDGTVSSEIDDFKKESLTYLKIKESFKGLSKEQIDLKYREALKNLEKFRSTDVNNDRIKSKLKKAVNTAISLISNNPFQKAINFNLIMEDAKLEKEYQEQVKPLLENLYLAGKVRKEGGVEKLEQEFDNKSKEFFSPTKYGAVSESILSSVVSNNPDISLEEATAITLDRVKELESGTITPVKKALTTDPKVLESLHTQLISSSDGDIILNPVYNDGQIGTKKNLSPKKVLYGKPEAAEYIPGKEVIMLTMNDTENKGYKQYAIGKGSNISKLTSSSMEALKDYSDALNSFKGMSTTKYIDPITQEERSVVGTMITMQGDPTIFEILRDVETGESIEHIVNVKDGEYIRGRRAYPGEITNYYITSALGK